jgi:hypothetical protein
MGPAVADRRSHSRAADPVPAARVHLMPSRGGPAREVR